MSAATFDSLEQVRCPACGELAGLEAEDVPAAVTYWAENGPVVTECGACGADLTLHEHMIRWWDVTGRGGS